MQLLAKKTPGAGLDNDTAKRHHIADSTNPGRTAERYLQYKLAKDILP